MTIEVNISESTVTINEQTCNFYEAGLYEVGSENQVINLTDKQEIVEILSDKHEGAEIEFVA